jgi:hypothetical protein
VGAGSVSCPVDNYDLAIHHLAGARWLLETGDTVQAARLLLWHQTFQWGPYWSGTLVLAPLAYLELARIEKVRGTVALTHEYYRQFLRRYDRPMPSEEPLVEEARRELD